MQRTAPLHTLIVCDMDGTLLNENHNIPDSFWPVQKQLAAQGYGFAPASGRQLYTLLQQFEALGEEQTIIAENGTVVYHQGQIISTTTMSPAAVRAIIEQVHAPKHRNLDWGVVLCRTDGAFIQRHDPAFLAQCQPYYVRLDIVDNLLDYVNDEVIKVAVYSFEDAEQVAAPLLRGQHTEVSMAISGAHWIDFMSPQANKGAALKQLVAHLGLDPSRTIVFGDYLNDLEMMRVAGQAIAMENAHPDIKALAQRIAPPNTEEGVVQVLTELAASL